MTKSKPTVDLGYSTPSHGRIPSFQSIEEEAEFWDTHDRADFPEEFELVEATTGSELADRLTIRLDRNDRAELDRQARDFGVGPSTLVRIWVRERLRHRPTGT